MAGTRLRGRVSPAPAGFEVPRRPTPFMDYTPPLAGYLLDNHRPLLVRLATEAVDEDREHAVTLSARADEPRLYASEDAEGGGRSVESPLPRDGAAHVVRLHTHPKETQVTFSTRDIVAFVRSVLGSRTLSSARAGPSGFGVIGRRDGDVRDREAHLQTIEPTQAWYDLDIVEREQVRTDVIRTSSDVSTRNEDSPLFDILEPYTERASIEYPLGPKH